MGKMGWQSSVEVAWFWKVDPVGKDAMLALLAHI
jgi:hypothetical protein